ncbi:hypothetical protein SASPL_123095 [Salvia splendens]|uniref:Zinc finger, CCHC-type n=1 Tax=Salvia splendens TaxID=180675 RepID=A0A8X8XQJ0_SALSN|nr:hypothetical protein SASPL_123095 [Salvia splendens]
MCFKNTQTEEPKERRAAEGMRHCGAWWHLEDTDTHQEEPDCALPRGQASISRHDKVEYVLDKPIGVIPDKESLEFATFDVEAHQKHIDNASDAQCVMLSSMSLELQRQHEHMIPYEMLKHLKSLYASQAQTMEYEILRDLFNCKLHDGSKVSEHVLKMIGLIERLASIGTVLPANISTNLILQSLPSSFENFIVNFNMNNTKVGQPELHNKLKTYESSTAKVNSVLMVSSSAKLGHINEKRIAR